MAPLTRRVSLTRTPWAPPSIVSRAPAGSQRTSGASSRRLLAISKLALMLLLELKAPVAAVLPTKNWAKSAVVALRVLAAATVTSRSRLMQRSGQPWGRCRRCSPGRSAGRRWPGRPTPGCSRGRRWT